MMTQDHKHEHKQSVRKDSKRMVVHVVFFLLMMMVGVLSAAPGITYQVRQWMLQGNASPSIELFELNQGRRVALEHFRGKVVLLDFWATWCTPCREQMPIVERLARDPKLKERVVVLSINTDDEVPNRISNIKTFMNMNRYKMMTVLDDGSARRAFHIQSIPTFVILTAQGSVFHLHSGKHTEAKLRMLLDEASKVL